MSQSVVAVEAALPASLQTWVLAQDKPFLLEDIPAVLRHDPRPEDLARRIAAHPQVARIGQKHYTPRVLAQRAPFVVRLLQKEREQGAVHIGHRFLPFHALDGRADRLLLQAEGGEPCEPRPLCVPVEDYLLSTRLLDPDPQRDDLAGSDVVDADCFILEDMGLRGASPPELEVRCTDFDRGVYLIKPHTPAPTREWRETKSILCGQMVSLLKSPPPGPVSAGRQMLHVVASALHQGFIPPVGPLGPLLTQDDRIDVDVVNGRTAFILAGTAAPPPLAPAPKTRSVADLIASCLPELQKGVKPFGRNEAHVYQPQWDGEGYRLQAAVCVGSDWSRWTLLDFSNMHRTIGAGCDCVKFRESGKCRHVVALLMEAVALLKVPRTPIAQMLHRDLARPGWVKALEQIEALARASAPGAEPDQRVTWRMREGLSVLALVPYVQKRQAAGGWTRGRQYAPEKLLVDEESGADEADVAAARALKTMGTCSYGPAKLPQGVFHALLHLVGHPRVYWEEDLSEPMTISKGAVSLAVEPDGKGDLSFRLQAGALKEGGTASCLTATEGVVLLDRHARQVVVAPVRGGVRKVLHFLAERKPTFPAEAKDSLLTALPSIEAAVRVDLPESLAGEEVPGDRKLRLRLKPEQPSGLTVALRVRPLAGGGLLLPGEPPERVSDASGGKRICVRRDLEDEMGRARGIAGALDLVSQTETSPWTWQVLSDDDALDLVAALSDGACADVIVEWDEVAGKMRLTREATPKDLRVAVQDAQDWFGIEGELEVDGAVVPLARLMEALRDGRRYVPVTGGMWVRISKLFQDRLREMADFLHMDHGKLRVGPAAAPLLREAVRETGLREACRAWEAFLERFDRAMAIEPDPAEGFRAELRPYQLEGYRWLSRLATWGVGGVLADDMGLGKTVQALALLVDRAKEGPALVVAPTSVGANWVSEARRFAPALGPVLYRETDRLGDPDAFRGGDLVVVSYAMALRDVEKLEKVKWGTLVLDEAQFVKNSQTKSAQAVRRIAAGWRVALTGTPIENHLGDLWSLFRAVSPGLFGSWERFRDRFAGPIERGRDPARREALARLVRPFVLRRTKGEVLRELPERTEIQLDAELSADERKLYDQARLAALVKLGAPAKGEDQRFQVLAALTRLRQLACHARLVLPETKAESSKLRVFLDTVEELREGGHRALVFSQFTSLLAIVREALDAKGVAYRYLDGSTPAAKRDQEVLAFQRGEGDLFLISLKAGGTGLNLTAADYVIHLDPWWNPAVEDQATNRAHRIGQLRPVTVYRIVASGTIEEKILSLHAAKRNLVEGVLDGTDQAGKLSTEDLISLMREG